ncbi:radical SAM family heme chaperone HemW [Malacoplasma iowae]|uniref:Heme chaperone HemW n=2 Tax=Malacoplasma iowae TaxID=2116 RepID=A0A6P1LF27_MALIO|nr:radical SAM family heme chaperone HemW [Malacoplasma iowae]VEU61932.1 Oxygen-independent coproporphyrinogen-III oxidase 2 [Mycoplasmopsis fermentans]AAG44089.1 species protein 1 [Malacoplasma iowae]EGZ31103.1 coproporphyrinogen III oxidase [Malacoplasma iowae 695]QHG90058.1 radical SAM family heme chaperone HemW [Malacoplasma iowae 695]WPL36209.1 radical SAM family heme chaperone HemW [Malacoplasma iowae]
MNNTKHLYIHIPFCKHICTYCDFVRKIPSSNEEVDLYLEKIVDEISGFFNKCKTIYIGGGTPNFLSDHNLDILLSSLQKNIDSQTEFTIELNPEFVTESQVNILKNNNVNRVSLGVQTTNEKILRLLNRKHTNIVVEKAINLLYKHNINNVSCDFIYNLPLLKISDINESIEFIKRNNIKHVSFYALEIKDGSIMNKRNEVIDIETEEDQLEHIENVMEKIGYTRYEVSNWSIDKKYFSKHNLAYWDLEDWKAIGIGAYGFEKNVYYQNYGSYLNYYKKNQNWKQKDIYLYILMMGLRKIDGIDLNKEINKKAYEYFKNKINYSLVTIKDNKLKANNVNILNEILIDLI